MRQLVLFFFLFQYGVVNGQTYSRVVPDEEIIDFINKDIARDSVKGQHLINPKYWKPSLQSFYYRDSEELASKRSETDFLFHHYRMNNGMTISNHLDTFFTRADIDYFKEQIVGLSKRDRWLKPFLHSKFVEKPLLDSTNHTEKAIDAYSIPIFSKDHQYAVVIKGFYCGLLCGGGAYYLYRHIGEDWKLVEVFNEWGE